MGMFMPYFSITPAYTNDVYSTLCALVPLRLKKLAGGH